MHLPFVPGYRKPTLASSLLKSERTVTILLLVRVPLQGMIQAAWRSVQKHRARWQFLQIPIRRIYRFNFEPIKAGACLRYREILILRTLVREKGGAWLQSLHWPSCLRCRIDRNTSFISSHLHLSLVSLICQSNVNHPQFWTFKFYFILLSKLWGDSFVQWNCIFLCVLDTKNEMLHVKILSAFVLGLKMKCCVFVCKG